MSGCVKPPANHVSSAPLFFLSSFFPTLTIISSVLLSFWNLHPFCRKSKKSRMTYFHSEKVSNEKLIIIIIFANRLSLCMWMVRNKRWLRIRRRWIWKFLSGDRVLKSWTRNWTPKSECVWRRIMTSNQEINRGVSIKCTSVTVEDRNYTGDKLINGRDTKNGPILFPF